MKKFAKKTEELIKLDENEIKTNLSRLDKCLVLLEKQLEKFNKPKKGWFGGAISAPDWFEGVGIGN